MTNFNTFIARKLPLFKINYCETKIIHFNYSFTVHSLL